MLHDILQRPEECETQALKLRRKTSMNIVGSKPAKRMQLALWKFCGGRYLHHSLLRCCHGRKYSSEEDGAEGSSSRRLLLLVESMDRGKRWSSFWRRMRLAALNHFGNPDF